MNLDKLNNNTVLDIFRTELNGVDAVLTGGAVVDILEDRVPKDYDFMYSDTLRNKLDDVATLEYTSKTAMTFNLKGYTIQLLLRKPRDFSYTIEQGCYSLNKKELTSFDKQSFSTKKLIPTVLSINFPKGVFKETREVLDRISATESLVRLPHWQRKGYSINDITYSTLIKIATKTEVQHGS